VDETLLANGRALSNSNVGPKTGDDTTQTLVEGWKRTQSSTQKAGRSTNVSRDFIDISVSEIWKEIVKFANSHKIQGEASEQGSTQLDLLLNHFKNIIQRIALEIITADVDADEMLWRTAEECYEEAFWPNGALSSSDYYDQQEETYSEGPYDPDFESEEYYEHENRLACDENYANMIQENSLIRHRQEQRGETACNEMWINFWGDALQHFAGSTTLFLPTSADEIVKQHLKQTDTPRYLFRVFDPRSSGTSNSSVVASIASKQPESDTVNLLSRPTNTAAQLVYDHLKKQLTFGNNSDNLMSWTSSLLFAIQYAIYRLHKYQCDASSIYICVLKTSKFPRRQFVEDLQILEAYRRSSECIGGEVKAYFRFRLKDERYQNGEYFSQGIVDHEGRSCLMSLKELIDFGLHDLYPDFESASGRGTWTNRVRDLRNSWCSTFTATNQDIRLAFDITCPIFFEFQDLDVTLALLLFKKRRLHGMFRDVDQDVLTNTIGSVNPIEWARLRVDQITNPIEVRRCINASKLLKYRLERKSQIDQEMCRTNVDAAVALLQELFVDE
jgi:hypothetical protein